MRSRDAHSCCHFHYPPFLPLISLPRWINVVCSDKCIEFIAVCDQLFVSTAVVVFLDKTMDINTFMMKSSPIKQGEVQILPETRFPRSIGNGVKERRTRTELRWNRQHRSLCFFKGIFVLKKFHILIKL
ncbi:hypothetical protein NE237_023328 [Protea cynaroides]|uniref:Uncharacterized protein n=1 Tax=Protea cynaroides TaxID=273540 RepID=A0A9Q0HCQ9_9MAGN|nr:hypothetical protein NE237_023328 [Protea cynaroides]